MARGAFPDTHPLALGMPGMHGTYPAVAALQEADLVVALGARFDDRVTGKLAAFAPLARIIHADIDPAEIGKNRAPDVAIIGDLRLTMAALADAVAAAISAGRGPDDTSAWRAILDGWKQRFPLRYTQQGDGPLKPQYVTERLSAMTGGEAIIVAGVGQHQMHAAQHYTFTRPRSWINSGGAGTMGFAVPAAMGAQVGRPGELVVAIDGDGCFQMTAQELATCAIEKIPIKVLIFNNGFLGMVRQWQELFYDERYSSVELGTAIPDYVKLAEAYGCVGLRCDRADEVDAVLDKALAPSDVPVIVDFRTHDREGVFPMVAAGHPNDDIILGPEFSADEQAAATLRKEAEALR
jgi:acetolactate synthase-1/2/3 large subunit